MSSTLASLLLGTAGLWVAALAAGALAFRRGMPPTRLEQVRRLTLIGALTHAAHAAEETATGFHVQFPALLGLSPWPTAFFVSFNLLWIAIWLLVWAAWWTACERLPRLAAFPVWFLAIAATANGVVHPALALQAAAYFPGLITSPLAGLVGLALLRALAAGPAGSHHAARPGR